jgi:putative transcriptional regulator
MPLFRTRLRVLRAERKWSQAKLAAQVGVTRQTINSIEKGRFHPNLRLAFKIARAFGSRSRKSLSMRIFDRPSAVKSLEHFYQTLPK